MRRWLGALALLLPAAAAGGPSPTAAIEVAISGVKSATGQVVVSVCPEDRFLKPCPWQAEAPAHPGRDTVVVRGVPPGRYAVQAFHDADNDGELDQGVFGIPKEGVGFSNDAMPRLIKPKFAVAAFQHGGQQQRIPVQLRYFLG